LTFCYFFVEGVQQEKKSPKQRGNAPSYALPISGFQNFAADTAKKTSRNLI